MAEMTGSGQVALDLGDPEPFAEPLQAQYWGQQASVHSEAENRSSTGSSQSHIVLWFLPRSHGPVTGKAETGLHGRPS